MALENFRISLHERMSSTGVQPLRHQAKLWKTACYKKFYLFFFFFFFFFSEETKIFQEFVCCRCGLNQQV